MTTKKAAAQKMADFILMFEFGAKERATRAAKMMSLNSSKTKTYLKDVFDCLPPAHRESWLTDEMLDKIS